MPLDPKAPNVVAVKGAKKVQYCSSGRKGQVTIVACGNAAGQVIPIFLCLTMLGQIKRFLVQSMD